MPTRQTRALRRQALRELGSPVALPTHSAHVSQPLGHDFTKAGMTAASYSARKEQWFVVEARVRREIVRVRGKGYEAPYPKHVMDAVHKESLRAAWVTARPELGSDGSENTEDKVN
jgi:hypothetical protein